MTLSNISSIVTSTWIIISRLDLFPSYLRSKIFPGKEIPLVYLVESADWSIRWDGIHITRGVSARGLRSSIDTLPVFYANRILHFGSSGTYCRGSHRLIDSSNKVVVTFFHGDYGTHSEMDKKLDLILKQHQHIDRLVVTASIMWRRFVRWGFPEEKLVLIPLGVDLQYFSPASTEERLKMRRLLEIPEEAVVIGSFQKDGSGWGEGLEPKLIKGPDIFVKAVLQLAKNHPVHCLLTGPARGFVKRQLERGGISYTHHFLKNPLAVAQYYAALDLYLVTSREEGGPKAIVESMAKGVPLISTKVGMAPDIIRHGENGFLLDIDDVDGIVETSEQVLHNKSQTQKMTNNAQATVLAYDWDIISEQYLRMYNSLLKYV